MNPETEPVRLGGWSALAAGAVLQAIILASAGTPPLGIAGAIASMLLLSIGGLEWARNRAWSPVAHFTEIRAVEDHVLEDLTDEEGAVDLGSVLTVLLIVLVVLAIIRLV